MIFKPKGTKDIFVDAWIYNYLESNFRQVAKIFNYQEVKTPIFEYFDLFTHSLGQTNDIVVKELYHFQDKANRKLALRPEGTAGIMRFYIENKLFQPYSCQKFFYTGEMFRYERPQKGRQRQFTQFGIENIGVINASVDVEVILLALAYLERINIKSFKLKINTLGSSQEQLKYKQIITNYFTPLLSSLCSDCHNRFQKNVLRILDCKNCVFKKDLPTIFSCLSKNSQSEFKQVKNLLDNLDVNYEVDFQLVRGLDYYNHTVFEIEPLNSSSRQSSLIGGGRYSNLSSSLGGPNIEGSGFALGLERIVNFVKQNNLLTISPKKVDAFIVSSLKNIVFVFKILNITRKANLVVDYDPSFGKLENQFKKLTKQNAKWAIIVEDKALFVKLQQPKSLKIKVSIKEIVKILKGSTNDL